MRLNSQYEIAWAKQFLNFADENFVVCFLALKGLVHMLHLHVFLPFLHMGTSSMTACLLHLIMNPI